MRQWLGRAADKHASTKNLEGYMDAKTRLRFPLCSSTSSTRLMSSNVHFHVHQNNRNEKNHSSPFCIVHVSALITADHPPISIQPVLVTTTDVESRVSTPSMTRQSLRRFHEHSICSCCDSCRRCMSLQLCGYS
jgi:hypothetical protein